MAKMIKKEELEYKNGYLVRGDEIVAVDPAIVNEAINLEYDVQKASFNKSHKVPAVSTEDFKFKHEAMYMKVTVDTPDLDDAIEKALKIAEDIETIDVADKVNKYLEGIESLIEFAANDYVVATDDPLIRFDLATIGDPLKLTPEKIGELVTDMFL